ncbi:hypothetical protein EX895_001367 [Sporisorium graminicola]|uniref:Uncharacterized protein n=1 Tax=Sporisorium graminicola TaxID=280036 RepID=A0A4U7L2P8_9BASI|nr:hypothetical protein EX895_001367 [Sporisorium graminicola]TKY89582.1 hypothetical protein EX895_001367 [Sporisorium graminicola]
MVNPTPTPPPLASTSSSSSPSSKPYLLAPEDLTSTLSSIELLSAMWSGTDELEVTAAAEATIRSVAEYLQLPLETLGDAKSNALKERIADEVVLGLKVRAEPAVQDEGAGGGVWVNVGFRLRAVGKEDRVRMWTSAKNAPSWLDRGRVEEVNAILAKGMAPAEAGDEEPEDAVGQILNAIEEVSEHILALPSALPSTSTTSTAADAANPASIPTSPALTTPPTVQRTWYYLPSLSTKTKRQDICTLAATSTPPLTGFLLAGKPGLIVLEYPLPSASPTAEDLSAAALALAAFWSTIKTTSWSDIPASHKKISEKLAQDPSPQAFSAFDDITDWPEVERGADRGRKSDLSKLIVWLDTKGLQGKWIIERCLGVGSWDP